MIEATSGNTTVCGIIGDPIGHSVSPAMHNAAFKELGINFAYVPFRVNPKDLGSAIEGMRALNIRGLNVTMPHKVAVIPFLDEIDPVALPINAVNVIVNDAGTLKGYNTDATGFLKALTENGIDPRGKNVVILGAGGASRAVCFILAQVGANLQVLNRTPERAAETARLISSAAARRIDFSPLDNRSLSKALSAADIVINTTSVGMNPDPESTPVDGDLIRPWHTIVDIVFNPIRTRLLVEANQAGSRTISGVEMLVWQGVVAFEKWTGLEAPVDTMRKAALAALKKSED